jgi:hypothetical protein
MAAASIRPARRAKGRDWIQDLPGPLSRAKNRPSPPNSTALHAASRDQAERHAGRIGSKAAGIDMQFLAGGKLALDQRAAHLDEDPAIAFQLLRDEAFAAGTARS